ncbi:MAG: phosphonate ABC transporter ATP-binding protein [Planctomycetota bacterium]
MIEIRELVKRYPGATEPALRGLNLTIERGEFVAIIGLSGSGKSTLLRCMNRLIDPTSGNISIKWKDGASTDMATARGSRLREARSRIGMIFQHFNLVRRKSVISNVISGSLARQPLLRAMFEMYTQPTIDTALAHLRRVGIENQAWKRADRLSGGQQQRVAIARALMQDVQLLLADEPVSALDPAISRSVMDHLKSLNREEGITVLCNLHFLDLVREYATRAIALKDGVVRYDGTPDGITNDRFREIYGEQAKEVSTI